MYIQSLTTEDDLWFIDTYPKEINSKPVNEQLLKDSGLKGVFRRKFSLLLVARMDIRRLRVENPDFYFYPFFSAMLAKNKKVQRNFLTTLKMAINELRAKKIPIPKWSVIMLNPSWGMHSTNQLHLLDQLNDNENYMICQTKKIIDNPGQINATISEMINNAVSGWYIKTNYLQSLLNSTSIELCEGGFIISTEILIRLERLGLMLAPLGNIMDRKLALGSWWYANNGLFNPVSFWLYNLANHASTAHFKGIKLKLTSLDELAAENDISDSTDEYIEYSKNPDLFIRPKPDTRGKEGILQKLMRF